MTESEIYNGFEISWQNPPATSAGFDVTIAAQNENLQQLLKGYFGSEGAHAFRVPGPLAQALKTARTAVDAVLASANR